MISRSRKKLELWNLDEREISRIEKDGVVYRVPIFSTREGFIVEKTINEGDHFMAGKNLLKIADLSVVWVYADIYEYELPFVRLDSRAIINLPYLPGETLEGKVSYIYPHLSKKTRTVRVRLEFPNPGYRLKPGMYATVKIKTPFGEHLVIPKDAVLNSGERMYVFVKKGKGIFEPRIIKTGPELEDSYIVEDGLAEGEEVVTSANFLIDSESKLKAALSGMGGSSH